MRLGKNDHSKKKTTCGKCPYLLPVSHARASKEGYAMLKFTQVLVHLGLAMHHSIDGLKGPKKKREKPVSLSAANLQCFNSANYR
jgi:hypothetical protein